jgi:hypothetical protein
VEGVTARQLRAEKLTKAARHNNVQLIQVWPDRWDPGCELQIWWQA